MRITIISPAGPRSRAGNRTTTVRWTRILRSLGHRVSLAQEWNGKPADLLVALHALRMHSSIARFRAERPDSLLIVALGGTDLYRDLGRRREARQSLELADRLIALQGLAVRSLPSGLRHKVRVIHQSVDCVRSTHGKRPGRNVARRGVEGNGAPLKVAVIAHLRPLKDPFRPSMAARLLPGAPPVRVFQVGAAMTLAMARRAKAEQQRNPGYTWLGSLPRGRTLAVMCRCDLVVVPSLMEGGANVIGEAVVLGVPVLASKIDGNVGLLGARYPGYFTPKDTLGLARLLERARTDKSFLCRLQTACAARKKLFAPARERAAWRALLAESR